MCKTSLPLMSKTNMPKGLSDPLKWEEYYQSIVGTKDEAGHISFGAIGGHLDHFCSLAAEHSYTSVWIPGCGLSALPMALSAYGLNVTATDASPTAIKFQHSFYASELVKYRERVAEKSEWIAANSPSAGSFAAEVHDFRSGYKSDAFDLIINVKSFSGLPRDIMDTVAAVHAQALRPGGRAYFDTLNVQGQNRKDVEQALTDAGFTIPYHEVTTRYRESLESTGIPYVFILGRPVVQRSATDQEDEWLAKRDRLFAIHNEYEAEMRATEHDEKRRLSEPDARVAIMIHNTG
jgi:SAM-dependent methyltransferase